jgi:hypothetical protein
MPALEIASFTVAADAADRVVAGHRDVIAELGGACPGLKRAQLVRPQADGERWLHLLTWATRDEAEAAAAQAPGLPLCRAWFGLLGDPALEHGDVVDEVVRA